MNDGLFVYNGFEAMEFEPMKPCRNLKLVSFERFKVLFQIVAGSIEKDDIIIYSPNNT